MFQMRCEAFGSFRGKGEGGPCRLAVVKLTHLKVSMAPGVREVLGPKWGSTGGRAGGPWLEGVHVHWGSVRVAEVVPLSHLMRVPALDRIQLSCLPLSFAPFWAVYKLVSTV